MDNYHVTHKDGEWKLKKENAERSTKNFETKEQAVDYAKDFMKKNGGSLKIHKQDGTIQEERTYPKSDDPIVTGKHLMQCFLQGQYLQKDMNTFVKNTGTKTT